jgi:hypothetical protein
MGEKCNGFNNRIGGNKKLAKALDIKEDLDINCLLYCEHRLNFCHRDNKNNLKQMFQRESACTGFIAECTQGQPCRTSAGGGHWHYLFEGMHGIHKEGWTGQGGTWKMELDTHGGVDGHNTRIITTYNPCKNKNVNSGTSYQQQCQYFITRKKEDLTYLLVLFRRNLIKQLKEW